MYSTSNKRDLIFCLCLDAKSLGRTSECAHAIARCVIVLAGCDAAADAAADAGPGRRIGTRNRPGVCGSLRSQLSFLSEVG